MEKNLVFFPLLFSLAVVSEPCDNDVPEAYPGDLARPELFPHLTENLQDAVIFALYGILERRR